tara:strand:+ start:498 stop:719 length:222 start_codon:yes stop_codon:yes gene_type:complete
MKGSKRGLKRQAMIDKIQMLEYALGNTINRLRNYETILDYYIQMNKHEKKFQKYLDKISEKNGEHKQEERKSS